MNFKEWSKKYYPNENDDVFGKMSHAWAAGHCNMTGVVNEKQIAQYNRTNFLKTVFLVCPLCGEDCFVEKVEGDNFITKCKCTKWKTSFRISEV